MKIIDKWMFSEGWLWNLKKPATEEDIQMEFTQMEFTHLICCTAQIYEQ